MMTWPTSYWQEKTKGHNYWYCCTSWCKGKGKRKRKTGKVPEFEKRDQKIVEIEKCRNCPCSVGVFGSVSAEFDKCTGKLGITCNVGVMQKIALLRTAKILRKVLEM